MFHVLHFQRAAATLPSLDNSTLKTLTDLQKDTAKDVIPYVIQVRVLYLYIYYKTKVPIKGTCSRLGDFFYDLFYPDCLTLSV